MLGVLYVVATPIGNLQDITRRAVDVLSSVQMIAAEDTRRTRVLLDEIGVHGVTLVAVHGHNEDQSAARVLDALQGGADVALVSDAGTPLLSDPGFDLVRRCWERRIQVLPIPGASALAAVLSVCPVPAGQFYFQGFLAARDTARRTQLEALLARQEAVLFFEAPHRIERCLMDIKELDPTRQIMLGREMTKRHESYLAGTPAELLGELRQTDSLRGEFVGVIEAGSDGGLALDVRNAMAVLASELPPSQAAKIGAALLGVNRRELYDLAIALGGPPSPE